MDVKMLIPGVGVRDAGSAAKAITSIPGWADQYAEGGGINPASVAQAVKESTYGYVCVQIRSTMMARIPWDIIGPNDEPVSDEHPLRILLQEFNPESNWNDSIRDTEADLSIYGNGFWLKVRSTEGATEGPIDHLMRLNPATMEVDADSKGVKRFIQKLKSGRKPFDRNNVVYFRTYDPTNDFGALSPAMVCMRDMQAEAYVSRYLRAFFNNYAMPAAILRTEQTIQEPDANRILRWWKRSFGGSDNKHQIGIMDKGLTLEKLSYPVNELALSDVRSEIRQSICSAFGVPATLAGAWEAANYATAKEQRRSLYSEKLFPEAEYMAGVINAELIADYGEDVKFVWLFDELDIMRQDVDEERDSIIALHSAGIMNTQAAAKRLDLEDDEIGDGAQVNPFMGKAKVEENEVEAVDISAALRKWRRKALKRVKEGQPAAVSFESDLIPDTLNDAILAQLKAAVTYSDVSAVFYDAIRHGSY